MKKISFLLIFMSIWTISYAQNYTLEELQKKFKPENYTEKVLIFPKNRLPLKR